LKTVRGERGERELRIQQKLGCDWRRHCTWCWRSYRRACRALWAPPLSIPRGGCEGAAPSRGSECIGTGAGSRLTSLPDSDGGIAIDARCKMRDDWLGWNRSHSLASSSFVESEDIFPITICEELSRLRVWLWLWLWLRCRI